MSETGSPGPESGQLAAGAAARSRTRWGFASLVLVLAAGALAGWRAGVFATAAAPATASPASALATRPVLREDIAAVTPVTATSGTQVRTR